MNALETEHSNLEIDSKLNRQPVKTDKGRCDVFMSWLAMSTPIGLPRFAPVKGCQGS